MQFLIMALLLTVKLVFGQFNNNCVGVLPDPVEQAGQPINPFCCPPNPCCPPVPPPNPPSPCTCPLGWMLSATTPVLGTTCTRFSTLPDPICVNLYGQFAVTMCLYAQVQVLPDCMLSKLLASGGGLGTVCPSGSYPYERNGAWRCINFFDLPRGYEAACPPGSFAQCANITAFITPY